MLSEFGALEAALTAAALLVGATGTWSPCGLSMIETVAPSGNARRIGVTLAACATFAPGAVIGGALTFGALGALGGLLYGAAGTVSYGVAAVVALGAAALEARGTPIVPQVRRQLPEHWRSLMPMPVAAGLYGVLLGLGFTTFVLSFGVWALAGISLALGEPGLGLLIGVAFGIGRAVPIVLIAPVADRPVGRRALDALTLRPRIYRGARLGDAVALGLVAAALGTGAADAGPATRVEARPAADPGLQANELVYQLPDRSGVIRRGGTTTPLPGRHPAIGGPYIAVASGGSVLVLDRETLEELGRFEATRVDGLAVNRKWIVIRRRVKKADLLVSKPITVIQGAELSFGQGRRIDRERRPSQLGKPALSNNYAYYAIARKRRNEIVRRKLPKGGTDRLLSSQKIGLSNPAVFGKRMVYIRSQAGRQKVMLKGKSGQGSGRRIYSRRSNPIIWSTALGPQRVFLTMIRRSGAIKVSSIPR